MKYIQFTLPEQLRAIIPGEEPFLLDWAKVRDNIPSQPGLYAFWWHGDPALLNGDQEVEFTGPAFSEIDANGKTVRKDRTHRSNFTIAEEYRMLQDLPICLYVGKSTNIRGRITQHLRPRLSTTSRYLSVKRKATGHLERLHTYTEEVSRIYRRDFDSQFRAGMEYLFRVAANDDDHLVPRMITEHVGLTFLPLADTEQADDRRDAFKRRFYWEDLLIGVLQPWFNLDGER